MMGRNVAYKRVEVCAIRLEQVGLRLE